MPLKIRRMIRESSIVTVLVAMVTLSGCDPYPSAPGGKLAVSRVLLSDQNQQSRPMEIESPSDPENIVVSKVPRHNSRIYIYFNKPIDGATVTQTSTSSTKGLPTFCLPADTVTVTETFGDSSEPQPITAQVCYDPSLPGLLVEPAVATCFGPEPIGSHHAEFERELPANYPQLDAGATYVITASGIKDHQGGSIATLKVTVQVASVLEPASYNSSCTPLAVSLPEDSSCVDISVDHPTDPSVAAGVPIGAFDEATGLYSVTTNSGVLNNYGTNVRFSLNDMICRATAEDLCNPSSAGSGNDAIKLTVGGTPIMYSAISDYGVNGDPRVYYAAPYLPLENDQEYSFTIQSELAAVPRSLNTTAPLKTTVAYYGKFRTEVGPPRVVWAYPLPTGVTTDPTTLAYPTTNVDLTLSRALVLGVGIATSTPLPVDAGKLVIPAGAEIGIYDESGNPISDLTPDVMFGSRNYYSTQTLTGSDAYSKDLHGLYGDDRNRFLLLGANAGVDLTMTDRSSIEVPKGFPKGFPSGQPKLNLDPDRTYTVKVKGLKAADGVTPVADFEYQFKTKPLDYDAGDPGSFDPGNSTAGGGGTFSPGAIGVNVVNRRNQNSFYLMQIPAPLDATTNEVGTLDDGVISGTQLKVYALPNDASVQLEKGGGGVVAGVGGYVRSIDTSSGDAAIEPWQFPLDYQKVGYLGYPGSIIGFMPSERLDFNSSYVLKASGLVSKGIPVPKITYPFTTRAFTAAIFDYAGFSRSESERAKTQLVNDAINTQVTAYLEGENPIPLFSAPKTVTEGVKPLIVATSGLVDVSSASTAIPHAETGELSQNAIRLLDNSSGETTDVAIHIEPFDIDDVGYTESRTRLLAVRPLRPLKAGTQYTLQISDLLKDRDKGVSVQPLQVSFVSASPSDLARCGQ